MEGVEGERGESWGLYCVIALQKVRGIIISVLTLIIIYAILLFTLCNFTCYFICDFICNFNFVFVSLCSIRN